MTEKRAHYAARLYSRHHRTACVVYRRAGAYLYDPLRPGEAWSPDRGELLAVYRNGQRAAPPA